MKKVLLVIDYQNDFVDGALGFEGAQDLDEKIALLIDRYHRNGDDVIFTLDTHFEDYLDTKEGIDLPVPHCMYRTEGHDLFGRVAEKKLDSDKVFLKSTFGSLDLANYLRMKKYDEVMIVGLVTDMCILSNAILAKAALPEAKIIVNSELVDTFDKDKHEMTLKLLKGVYINVR